MSTTHMYLGTTCTCEFTTCDVLHLMYEISENLCTCHHHHHVKWSHVKFHVCLYKFIPWNIWTFQAHTSCGFSTCKMCNTCDIVCETAIYHMWLHYILHFRFWISKTHMWLESVLHVMLHAKLIFSGNVHFTCQIFENHVHLYHVNLSHLKSQSWLYHM